MGWNCTTWSQNHHHHKTTNIKNARTEQEHKYHTRMLKPHNSSTSLKLHTGVETPRLSLLISLFLARSSGCGLLALVVCISSSARIEIGNKVVEELSSGTCSKPKMLEETVCIERVLCDFSSGKFTAQWKTGQSVHSYPMSLWATCYLLWVYYLYTQ
jgi:hypothetical protein